MTRPTTIGELRKVKLQYRCSLCGTEVRMTVATEEHPDPPRHCMDEMELVVTEE
jgi:DNA-directed RNA polymerase subunit RPC12/RpoP